MFQGMVLKHIFSSEYGWIACWSDFFSPWILSIANMFSNQDKIPCKATSTLQVVSPVQLKCHLNMC